ncbi:MAG: hypothetical protein WKF30_15020, partial [Pyrinomonadaceae bacterium]
MKCEECLPSIDDYVEEELDLQDAGPLAAHLASCQKCSGVYEESLYEKQAYDRYRRQLSVPPAMWNAVRARIADQKPAASFWPQWRELAHAAKFVSATFTTRYASVAALALLCAFALIGYYALINSHNPTAKLLSGSPDRRVAGLLPAQGDRATHAPLSKPGGTSDAQAIAPDSSDVRLAGEQPKIADSPRKAESFSPDERREHASDAEHVAAKHALLAAANQGAATLPHSLTHQFDSVKEVSGLMPGSSTPFDVQLVPWQPRQITLPVANSFRPTAEAYVSVLRRQAAQQFDPTARRQSDAPPIVDAMFAPKAGGETDFKLAKFEMGGHVSSLSLGRGNTSPGVGSRLTYNVNNFLALETEGNIFPGRLTGNNRRNFLAAAQVLFGAKIGKRWKKIGVFAKLRP